MGYTIATPIRNVKLRDQVVAFLDKEYRNWPELHGGKKTDPCYISPPLPNGTGHYQPVGSRNLDYDNGSCRIGFNYKSSAGERDYAFTFCRWLALRFGKLRRFKGFAESCPHIVLDGSMAWPVLIRRQWQDVPRKFKWAQYDRWGCRRMDPLERKFDFARAQYKEHFTRVRTELKRLDAAWVSVSSGLDT